MEDLLCCAAEEVLETMFYSAVFGPGTESAEGPHWCAGVTYQGSRGGALAVSLPQSTAMALAAAFLGESVESAPEAQVPTVIELANVLCGVLLGRMEEGGQFVIAPPQRKPRKASP
jgi:CheY-specific phosphatase CheX